jgi:D-sedoheptulose 7-phosphate isomerase
MELNMIDNLIKRYPALKGIENDIKTATDILYDCYKKGGKILLCGNGGSASDCEHIAGELLKGFLSKRKMPSSDAEKLEFLGDSKEFFENNLQRGIPAISLPSQAGIISAFCNDVEPSLVYAQLVYAYKGDNDVLVGLSTSGNSKNVVNAFKVAKAFGVKTIAFTGSKACALDEFSSVTIKAPETETYKVQEYHLAIYHAICAELEKIAFNK